jgi:hypothetical protein
LEVLCRAIVDHFEYDGGERALDHVSCRVDRKHADARFDSLCNAAKAVVEDYESPYRGRPAKDRP